MKKEKDLGKDFTCFKREVILCPTNNTNMFQTQQPNEITVAVYLAHNNINTCLIWVYMQRANTSRQKLFAKQEQENPEEGSK